MKRFTLLFCLVISLSLFPFLNYCLAFEPSNDNIYKGIDISQWQENINFTKVKNNGIEVVYIKATQGNDYIDPYFKRNYENAKNVGLKIGVYHFLTARNIEEAIDEADFFCSVISNKKINCKLAMDFESFGRLTKEEINEISKYQDLMMICYGYLPIFYSRRYLVSNYLQYIGKNNTSDVYYIKHDNDCYPIMESDSGTCVYTKKPINLINEINDLNIEYIILNSFLIDDSDFIKIMEDYIEGNISNDSNYLGFLNEKTIYKVKDNG